MQINKQIILINLNMFVFVYSNTIISNQKHAKTKMVLRN